MTSLLPGRDRARAQLRLLIVAIALGVVGCSGDDNASTQTTDAALVPDATALAPGECDPTQSLAPPEITTGGKTTLATLGIGDFTCGGLNGDGYISFHYNPVLIEGEGTIEVTVGAGITATIAWTGDVPFTESGDRSWTSTLSERSCNRLTIELTGEPGAPGTSSATGTSGTSDTSGTSTATYGADIRVGGDEVDCPQRSIDPADPTDSQSGITGPVPPGTTEPR